jgi:hypothetical protein
MVIAFCSPVGHFLFHASSHNLVNIRLHFGQPTPAVGVCLEDHEIYQPMPAKVESGLFSNLNRSQGNPVPRYRRNAPDDPSRIVVRKSCVMT